MHNAKIYEAVLSCLTSSKADPDPHDAAQRFIERLASSNDWASDEVEEVQRLVFDQLLDVA